MCVCVLKAEDAYKSRLSRHNTTQAKATNWQRVNSQRFEFDAFNTDDMMSAHKYEVGAKWVGAGDSQGVE